MLFSLLFLQSHFLVHHDLLALLHAFHDVVFLLRVVLKVVFRSLEHRVDIFDGLVRFLIHSKVCLVDQLEALTDLSATCRIVGLVAKVASFLKSIHES